MNHDLQLLIIDPQNDFCDLPDSWRIDDPLTGRRIAPALPVAGAHADLRRLAGLIRARQDRISDIWLTLDSHHRVDIAHPAFWAQADGSTVEPFTTITARQVRDGLFRPRDDTAMPRVLAYLDALAATNRYTLMVWPVHCEIGTWGHNVHADVMSACATWEERRLRVVRQVIKGTNSWTEHYSALRAEVPDPDDPQTELDEALIAELARTDLLLIAGQASSHCVKATVEHLVDNLPADRHDKLILLTDCMSPVAGFEAMADRFLADMAGRGVRLATTTDVLNLSETV